MSIGQTAFVLPLNSVVWLKLKSEQRAKFCVRLDFITIIKKRTERHGLRISDLALF
jgi:uncharacterized protein YcaQ